MLLNYDFVFTLNGKSFNCGFNHENIAVLEEILNKGFYKIYEDFIIKNHISDAELINIFAISAFKYHSSKGVWDLKNVLLQNLELSSNQIAELKLCFKYLVADPQEFNNKIGKISDVKITTKSSEYYNFDENYAIARNFLLWSDSEFWSATPAKFNFSILSMLKYNADKKNYLEKMEKSNSIQLLKSMKNLI
ncbi:hypothetical protein IJG14_00230 [bacterium]|nr:hypothetical protein [bacterium]